MAEEFTRAFLRESAVTVHFRSYFLDRKTPTPPGPGAWASGGWLGYESGWFANVLRVGMVGYTSQPIWAPLDRDGTLLLKPGQEEYTVLGQAYVSLRLWDQVFTGYRQVIDQPEVNPNDGRMTPNTFEGYVLAGKVGPFNYFGGFLDKMKSRNADTFQNFATQAGAPVGVSEPMWLGTLRYSPLPEFTARLSSYHVPNILTSTYADVSWLTSLSDATKLKLGGQFMSQGSTGNNLLTGSSFNTWAGGIKADLIWGPVTATIAYNQTDRGAAYQAPYGGWAGYTKMLIKDFDRAGERALLAGAAFDFASVNLPGLSLFTNAVFGHNAINPTTGAKLSNNKEYDFTLDYRFTASNWPKWLRSLGIEARAAYLGENLNGVTNTTTDYRIIVNYEWVFK